MKMPEWANLAINPIDYNEITYYSIPKQKKKLNSLDEVDPEILKTFEKLGISFEEQKKLSNVAVDAVFDSISIGTTYKEKLGKAGVIFCSISEAIHLYPKLIEKFLGSVISSGDNFFASLNSAVFSDGSFCYIPKNVQCPLELSTYFRINDKDAGQFERTLIIAEKNSSVNYLEGCTAPQFSENQLHAAIVELVAFENARIKYSTVQNWYSGNEEGITTSKIISKGISCGFSKNSYRGLVKIGLNAAYCRNFSQCDSFLIGSSSLACTYPYLDIWNSTAIVEHEATISKISEEQLFYLTQRGIKIEHAIGLLINGFCKDVVTMLPMEFATEADKLLSLKLEGTVG